MVGVLIMLVRHKDMKLALPFGPFLALGAISFVFFGPEVIYWYARIVR
jgi:leader peptidase (prepilin peptidase)/N-methyltransferase